MKRNRENHHHFLQEPNSKKGTKPAVNFTFDDEENEMTALTLGSLATRAPPPPQLHSLLLLVEEPEPQPQPQPTQPQRQIHSYDDQVELPPLANYSIPPQEHLHEYQAQSDNPHQQLPSSTFDRFSSLPSSSSLVLNDVQSQLPAAATTTAASAAAGSSNRRQPRGRRSSRESPNLGNEDPTTVPAPYPWATTQHAVVHSKEYLLKNGITDIRGKVQCKKCHKKYVIGFDLETEFKRLYSFIEKNKIGMRDRAPACWSNPVYPTCKFCKQEDSARPIVAAEEREGINWLFLLLGQFVGICSLEQLKYFCKNTKNHRTGAKDRVLYLTYMELCNQVDPNGPFDPLER